MALDSYDGSGEPLKILAVQRRSWSSVTCHGQICIEENELEPDRWKKGRSGPGPGPFDSLLRGSLLPVCHSRFISETLGLSLKTEMTGGEAFFSNSESPSGSLSPSE